MAWESFLQRGAKSTATYGQVITETAGHAESVEVIFDPSRITFGQLLQAFFSVAHDPTQLNPLREYQAALDTYSKAGLKRELVEALGELGELQLLLGQPDESETSFRRALVLARSIGHRPGEIAQLVSLGAAILALARLQSVPFQGNARDSARHQYRWGLV